MAYPHDGHPSATGRAWDKESPPVKDWHSTKLPTVQSSQPIAYSFKNNSIRPIPDLMVHNLTKVTMTSF